MLDAGCEHPPLAERSVDHNHTGDTQPTPRKVPSSKMIHPRRGIDSANYLRGETDSSNDPRRGCQVRTVGPRLEA
jgi:hypothetical protein